jgi:hypothetical protein
LLVVPPERVIRSDGKRVIYERAASPAEELKNVLGLFTDKYMLLLTPMILQSNWFYTYDFGGMHAQQFWCKGHYAVWVRVRVRMINLVQVTEPVDYPRASACFENEALTPPFPNLTF